MKRKATLEKQIRSLRMELSALEDAENKKKYAGLKGCCFSYKNCYSLPKGEQDYWTVFARVTSVDGAFAHVFRFEADNAGKIAIAQDELILAESLMRSWTLIPRDSFDRQLHNFKIFLDNLLEARGRNG